MTSRTRNKGKRCWIIVYIQWYCSVNYISYTRSLEVVIPDFISTSWIAYSQAAHWQTEMINLWCHYCPHCTIFYFSSMMRQWKWTCPSAPLWQIQPRFKPMTLPIIVLGPLRPSYTWVKTVSRPPTTQKGADHQRLPVTIGNENG